MARPTGLRGIAYCYFSIYHTDGIRKTKSRRVILLGFCPLVIGVVLAWRLGGPSGDKLSLIVAVLAVLAAVLIGLLPLAHSILAQTESKAEYKDGERPLAKHALDRVQVLQDLHASISWSVILLVVGLGASAVMVLLGLHDLKDPSSLQQWTILLLMFVLYSVMASTAFTFFDVATGVFEAMESHAESIKRRIRQGIQKYPPPDVED